MYYIVGPLGLDVVITPIISPSQAAAEMCISQYDQIGTSQ